MTPEKKNQILAEIDRLRAEKDVLILAHLYEDLEIQRIADFCGDSFELAKRAKASDKQNIVFCGVKFMGESAKLLCPEKHVFLPVKDAGCAMADMVTPEDIRALKAAHPNAAVVCYINSSAETKALCDMCVTSSNALHIIAHMDADEIIFVPDKNLGSYIAASLPEKTFYLHSGYCPVHRTLTKEAVLDMKAAHPDALFLVHPECEPEVVSLCDYAGSTSGIIAFAKESDKKEWIIGTERAVFDRLSEECPDKTFYLPSETLVCPDMKKTTLDDLYKVMCDLSDEVMLDETVAKGAVRCLENMLEAGSAKHI